MNSTDRPAPAGLRPEEVALLIDELAPFAVGARIEKVYDAQPSSRTSPPAWRLRLRVAQSIQLWSSRRLDLLISVRAGFTRFHAIDSTPLARGSEPAGNRRAKPSTPKPMTMALRELLRGGIIESIDQPGAERVARFVVLLKRDGERIRRSVVLELFGAMGRLVVFENASTQIRWLGGRGGYEIGHHYRFPANKPKSETLAPPFEPKLLIPEDQRGDPLAFNLALARRMAVLECECDLVEAKIALDRRVAEEAKRRRRLLDKLAIDYAEAAAWQRWQSVGELLKGNIHRLERGMTDIEVVDYYDAEMPSIRVELDPCLAPTVNVERYFRRARKGKRAVDRIEARRRAAEQDLELLEQVRHDVTRCESVAAVDRLASELDGLRLAGRRRQGGQREGGKQKGARQTARRGPKRYRTRQGLEVLSGRNARENDRLTLTVARGNDLFFHIAGRAGAHVILRVPKGQSASPESLEDAAFLAAYLSGWRGPGTTVVHWTQAKYVRKPKGMPPGKVLIAREREFRVAYKPELLNRLADKGTNEPS